MRLPARAVWCAYVLLLSIASVPVLSVTLPPLFDYPNHLARMHLLAEGGDRFFQVNWRPLPNLAEDLIVPPLSRVMPLAAAAKAFLVLTLALLAAGPLLLSRSLFGCWSAWPLGGFLFVYSRSLLWGFLNYLFGLGLALCGAALWTALGGRPWPLRLGLGAIVATVCYLGHIEAFGCYAVIVAGLEAPAIVRGRDWRRALLFLGTLLPAIALYLITVVGTGGGGVSFAGFGRKLDLLFSVFDNYHRPVDVGLFVVVAMGLIGLAATRSLKADRRGAVALALLAIAYLLLPSQLLTGSGADHRLPAALFLLLFGVTEVSMTRRRAMALAAVFMILFVVRMGLIEQVWRKADVVYRADLAVLDQIPDGAAVAVAFPDSALNMVPVPETHLPLLAVIEREAFVPTLFAYPTQQPIRLAPSYRSRAEQVGPGRLWHAFTDTDDPALRQWLAAYDFVLVVGRDVDKFRPDTCLSEVVGTPTFRLLRVAAAACIAGAVPR